MSHYWKLPYPIEEQLARVICGDPVAIRYQNLKNWIEAQNFKPPIAMTDALNLFYMERFARLDHKYRIPIGNDFFPDNMPDELYYDTLRIFDGETHGTVKI